MIHVNLVVTFMGVIDRAMKVNKIIKGDDGKIETDFRVLWVTLSEFLSTLFQCFFVPYSLELKVQS